MTVPPASSSFHKTLLCTIILIIAAITKVLVNWILVPAASIMELIGDALKIIVLEAGRSDDAEDTVLIRTLRPVAAVRAFSRTLRTPDIS